MISAFYDQNGVGPLVMGPRTGTPMRLVSPAPVMVPTGAQRTPQAPQIYPPQPQTGQQNLYSTQNGTSIAGKVSFTKRLIIFFTTLIVAIGYFYIEINYAVNKLSN